MLDLLMFVKPSTRLDPTLRKIVLAAFDDAIASIGDREYEYIEKRCLRKIDSLASSRTSWVRDLADATHRLQQIHDHARRGTITVEAETLQVIGACLFYVVNPFDIIADSTPGTGYTDDAEVVNVTIRRLSRVRPDLTDLYFGSRT